MQMKAPDLPYSEYVVYVDESGDHSLNTLDARYPVFVLSLCVFRKTVYNQQLAPALRALKFACFGHDMVVLHESEMRRGRGAFSQLPLHARHALMEGLHEVIRTADFQLIAVAIARCAHPVVTGIARQAISVYVREQGLGLEWLEQEIAGARPHRFDCTLHLGICGHQQYRQRRIPGLRPLRWWDYHVSRGLHGRGFGRSWTL